MNGYQIQSDFDRKLFLGIWRYEHKKETFKLAPTESFSVEMNNLSESQLPDIDSHTAED